MATCHRIFPITFDDFHIFRRYETLPPWRLAPTLSLATCLSNLRVVGRGPARDVGLRPLGRGGNAGSVGHTNSVTSYDVTEIGRQTFGEGRANSVASQNSVARLRQKLARIRLRDRDDVTSDARRPKGGYSARFPAVSLP